MKRVMIGLIALGGLALWWTDVRAQCTGGVGSGGSCITRGLLRRSFAGVTRSIYPGASTFEFFGTQGPSCNHNFSTGVLDCDCRIRGTAYCTPSVSSFSFRPFSGGGGHGGGGSGGGSGLKKKTQTLPARLTVNNIGDAAPTTESPSGDQGFFPSYWTVAELEPNPSCVSCPGGTSFLTFLASEVVMRVTFVASAGPESGTPRTSIQICRAGGGNPTEIESFDCGDPVFECTGAGCSGTSPACGASCEESED
jgi:hypothetical protein